MIHTVHTMSIGLYGQLDRTQDARLLKRWFNPFSVRFFKKRIERFFDSVHEIMNQGQTAPELLEQMERLYNVNKMLQLSILYDALQTLLIMQAQLDMILILAGREIPKGGNLSYYTEEVKRLTGIDIKSHEDLPKLAGEVSRLKDKFAERFPEKSPEKSEPDEKPSFIKGALSIFAVMEMPYNERMTLAEFAELKTLAFERNEQIKRQLEKYKDNGTD